MVVVDTRYRSRLIRHEEGFLEVSLKLLHVDVIMLSANVRPASLNGCCAESRKCLGNDGKVDRVRDSPKKGAYDDNGWRQPLVVPLA